MFKIIIMQQYLFLFRDIKPQNLLLFDNGKLLKITDLGLARNLENSISMSCDAGTPLYISPGIG